MCMMVRESEDVQSGICNLLALRVAGLLEPGIGRAAGGEILEVLQCSRTYPSLLAYIQQETGTEHT